MSNLLQVNAKEAAKIAKDYFDDIGESYTKIRLEEIELSEDGKYWNITLGIFQPIEGINPVMRSMYTEGLSYKLFKIDATSGEVISMKIRQISQPSVSPSAGNNN